MNHPDPETAVLDQDTQLRERIRAEVKALLNQQKNLSHLEQNAAMQEKIRRMSHAIRNPLATIQAVCSSLILETEDSEQLERLQMINAQVDQLSELLTGAVDRVQDPEEHSDIDLGELTRALVNLLQYQASTDLDIQLHLPRNLQCTLPVRALTRSLYQLLHNALEATQALSPAVVQLRCFSDDTHVEIHVLDNGPGFPATLLELGLRAYAAANPGSALGLCSVERFASGLGGRLELKNRDTGGAWVRLLLPATPKATDSSPL